jgi:hypothetical protein
MNTVAGVRAIAWDLDEAATAVTRAAVTAIRTAVATVIRAVATAIRAAVRRIAIGPRLRRGRPRRFRIAHEATESAEVAEGGPFRVLV